MKPSESEHIIVYRDENAFCGWPFNGGMWTFGDGEIAAGFIRGACDYSAPHTLQHAFVDNLKGEQLIVRSRDGGRTWNAGAPEIVYRRPEFDFDVVNAPVDQAFEPGASKEDGFCLLSGFGIPHDRYRQYGFVLRSLDRGKTWTGPYRLEVPGYLEIGSRPSYIVRDDGMVLLFAHGSRNPGEEWCTPLVFGSSNGGTNWALLAEIELSPRSPMGIMPYPLYCGGSRVLITVRRQYGFESAYTQIYESVDSGRSWSFLSRVNDWGAPASLNRLSDGRLVCVYGYRRPPYGIRAAVSEDGGRTWGPEVILRDDGAGPDLGYPRSTVLADDTVVSLYYFYDRSEAEKNGIAVR